MPLPSTIEGRPLASKSSLSLRRFATISEVTEPGLVQCRCPLPFNHINRRMNVPGGAAPLSPPLLASPCVHVHDARPPPFPPPQHLPYIFGLCTRASAPPSRAAHATRAWPVLHDERRERESVSWRRDGSNRPCVWAVGGRGGPLMIKKID